jgi:ADP-ribose/FAD diphosphatase
MMNFCTNCGKSLVMRIPKGDDHCRYICDACGKIHYSNPKMVVGAIPVYEGRILICRRAIEPRYGLWTLPAGFMEDKESVEEGARREAFEEAGVGLDALIPFALFSLPFISQVYLMFRAELPEPRFSAGRESLEVKLVSVADLPWEEIAFPVIRETLRLFVADQATGNFGFHCDTINNTLT